MSKRKAIRLTKIEQIELLDSIARGINSDNNKLVTVCNDAWNMLSHSNNMLDGVAKDIMAIMIDGRKQPAPLKVIRRSLEPEHAEFIKSIKQLDRSDIVARVATLQIQQRHNILRLISKQITDADSNSITATSLDKTLKQTRILLQQAFTSEEGYTMARSAKSIERMQIDEESVDRAKLGFKIIDDYFEGFMPCALNLLVATSGGCKTTVAVNIFRKMAWSMPVAFVTHENTGAHLSAMIATGLLHGKDNKRTLTQSKELGSKDKEGRLKVAAMLAQHESMILVADRGSSTTSQLEAQMIKNPHIKVWFVDSLNNMIERQQRLGGDKQYVQYGNAANALFELARQYKVTIVVTAQMNQDGDVKYSKEIFELSKTVLSWGFASLSEDYKDLPEKPGADDNENKQFQFRIAKGGRYQGRQLGFEVNTSAQRICFNRLNAFGNQMPKRQATKQSMSLNDE